MTKKQWKFYKAVWKIVDDMVSSPVSTLIAGHHDYSYENFVYAEFFLPKLEELSDKYGFSQNDLFAGSKWVLEELATYGHKTEPFNVLGMSITFLWIEC